MTIENTIFKNLLKDENYARKSLPFLQEEYFTDSDKILFTQIKSFVDKYNKLPTPESLKLDIESLPHANDVGIKKTIETIDLIAKDTDTVVYDWLVDTTEKFCQEKALYNAMVKSLEIMNDTKKGLARGSIPKLLSDALGISFDPSVGHDYLEDSDKRFEVYHSKVSRIPWDIDILNLVTENGLQQGTLTVFLAPPNTGKSLILCHCSAANLSLGKNVLYISLEMSENMVSKRIDANLLNISLKDILSVPKDIYDQKITSLKSKTNGKLIIKQYPTTGASVLHFKSLLNELALKKNFKPDVIYVDYLNLCSSARFKANIGGTNSYAYVKSVGEELRGMAVECNVPIVTATQVNRSGSTSSDFGMEDLSDSFGTGMTADDIFGVIETDDLRKLGQLLFKQIKRRDGDKSTHERFIVGVDKFRQKLYNVEQIAQNGLIGNGTTQSSTSTTIGNNKFSGFKFKAKTVT